MQGKSFANYMVAITLASISTGGSLVMETMAQGSTTSQGLTQQTTNPSPPDLSYENVLKAARKTPISITGNGFTFGNPMFDLFSSSAIFDKVSIHIDGNQASFTFLYPQTQLKRTKVTFIGNFKEIITGFIVNLQSTKFEYEVYDSVSKQFRLSSQAEVVIPQNGSCFYRNDDIIVVSDELKLGKFGGRLTCNATFSGKNLFGYSEVQNVSLTFDFRAKGRE
jgi:hypothetical protein